MKRILFVTAYPINNKTAGQNYSLHLLQDLSTEYVLDILYWSYKEHSSISTFENSTHYSPNSSWKTIVYSLLMNLFPLFVVRFDKQTLKHIQTKASEYDVLYFDFSQTFIYSLFVQHSCKIMMCHDVIAQKYQRTRFSYLYNWWVRYSEKKLLKTAWKILTFSSKDQQLIKTLYGLDTIVVPFYVDEKINSLDFSSLQLGNYFTFYGAWNRKENLEGLLWFLQKVLPNLSSGIKIKILGGGLKHKETIELINQSSQVEYLGFVDNPYPIIAEARALIAPLFKGAGVKVKVIESMAVGTPVIGTEIAFEGIENIYINQIPALYHAYNVQDFVDIINNFKEFTVDWKQKLHDNFLRGYSRNKFVNLLRSEIA